MQGKPSLRSPFEFESTFTIRAAEDDIEEEQKNTCILLIHVDHMFTSDSKFQRCQSTGMGERKCEVDREEILSFIQSHVKGNSDKFQMN